MTLSADSCSGTGLLYPPPGQEFPARAGAWPVLPRPYTPRQLDAHVLGLGGEEPQGLVAALAADARVLHATENRGAATLAIAAPILVRPVKAMASIAGCATSAWPTLESEPWRISRTPGGSNPAWMQIREQKGRLGASSEGLAPGRGHRHAPSPARDVIEVTPRGRGQEGDGRGRLLGLGEAPDGDRGPLCRLDLGQRHTPSPRTALQRPPLAALYGCKGSFGSTSSRVSSTSSVRTVRRCSGLIRRSNWHRITA